MKRLGRVKEPRLVTTHTPRKTHTYPTFFSQAQTFSSVYLWSGCKCLIDVCPTSYNYVSGSGSNQEVPGHEDSTPPQYCLRSTSTERAARVGWYTDYGSAACTVGRIRLTDVQHHGIVSRLCLLNDCALREPPLTPLNGTSP